MKKSMHPLCLAKEDISVVTQDGLYTIQLSISADQHAQSQSSSEQDLQEFPAQNHSKSITDLNLFYQNPFRLYRLLNHSCMAASIHLQIAQSKGLQQQEVSSSKKAISRYN